MKFLIKRKILKMSRTMNYPYKSDQQKSVHVTEKLTYQNHMLKILKSL
jgi:hypothetical protein